MADFLKTILPGENGSKELPNKIESTKTEIIHLKEKLNSVLETKDKHFTPFLNNKEELVDQSKTVFNDIKTLQSRLDEQIQTKLKSCSTEMQTYLQDLKEYNYTLQLISQLLKIFKDIELLKKIQENQTKDYCEAATILNSLNQILLHDGSDIQQLDLYKPLMDDFYKLSKVLIDDIIKSWHEKIKWNLDDLYEESMPVTLCIECEYEEMEDMMQGLLKIDKLNEFSAAFAKKLYTFFITKIIKHECQVKIIDEKIFSVEVLDKRKIPSCTSVLYSLELLFDFLYQHFDVEVDSEHFLQKLSNYLFEDFSKTLIEDCIMKTIPTSKLELESFSITVQEIEEFQKFLQKVKFIKNDQNFLSTFSTDIDKLYISRKCEVLLTQAKQILKQDLHKSMKYTVDEKEILSCQNFELKIERKLCEYTFHFPSCQISKSAQAIIELQNEILQEAINSDIECALKLFYTTRNIFEMCIGLVPEIHKSFLEFPNQIALFHNNCMYLAHHAMTLILHYQEKFPNTLRSHILTYTDQVFLLREVGTKYLLQHMQFQGNVILNILKESGLSLIGQSSELPPATEKALKQCIRQLEILQQVWLETLPENVYCRALGCIVNDMVNEIINRVVSVEDIPAKIASELVTNFSNIMKKIPKIFPEATLVQKFVKHWNKLNELNFILGASLKDIEDRWADGKGPLANEFSSKNVKMLIRALFQNTDRRSSVLAKIKEK